MANSPRLFPPRPTTGSPSFPRRVRRVRGILPAFPCALALLCSVALPLWGAESSAGSVSSVQKAVADWARVREETVRLESTWETERQLLHSTLNALQERARTLADEKKTLTAKTAEERSALDALARENGALQSSLDAAVGRLKKLTERLVELRPMLPPRLARALELPYRSLANPELSPGERMQYLTTILNRCEQFNNAIAYDEEPVTVPGESGERLLEVIYWGASHGYALDRTGGKAYRGAPGAGGWNWSALPDGAGAVTQLIAIYREKSDPRFVEVPARVDATPAH